jgi:hypothetical protein
MARGWARVAAVACCEHTSVTCRTVPYLPYVAVIISKPTIVSWEDFRWSLPDLPGLIPNADTIVFERERDTVVCCCFSDCQERLRALLSAAARGRKKCLEIL